LESIWNLPGFRLEEQAGKAPVWISAQLNRGGLERGVCARWPDLSYPILMIFGSEKLLASEILLLTVAISQLESFNQPVRKLIPPPPLPFHTREFLTLLYTSQKPTFFGDIFWNQSGTFQVLG
jgi:hypothetical protein